MHIYLIQNMCKCWTAASLDKERNVNSRLLAELLTSINMCILFFCNNWFLMAVCDSEHFCAYTTFFLSRLKVTWTLPSLPDLTNDKLNEGTGGTKMWPCQSQKKNSYLLIVTNNVIQVILSFMSCKADNLNDVIAVQERIQYCLNELETSRLSEVGWDYCNIFCTGSVLMRSIPSILQLHFKYQEMLYFCCLYFSQ